MNDIFRKFISQASKMPTYKYYRRRQDARYFAVTSLLSFEFENKAFRRQSQAIFLYRFLEYFHRRLFSLTSSCDILLHLLHGDYMIHFAFIFHTCHCNIATPRFCRSSRVAPCHFSQISRRGDAVIFAAPFIARKPLVAPGLAYLS